MKIKNFLIILLIFLLFLSFGAVQASDVDSNSTNSLSQSPVTEKTFSAIQTTIDNANQSDVILLEGSYSGSGKAININKPVTIKGTGNGATLNALKKSQILTISADNVILENIAFVSGIADDRFDPTSGGAINNQANNLKIINCKFSLNTAKYGGAVYCEGNNVSIINSQFTNNNVETSGGAIELQGNDNYVDKCSFNNNRAYHAGGAVSWIGNNGILTNSVFTYSIEDMSQASEFGGAIVWIGSNGQLSKSSFYNNKARYSGASIYWRGSNGSLTYCIFENSTSNKDLAYFGNPDNVNFNYWGVNVSSSEEFKNQKLIYYNDGYASPDNWVNIELIDNSAKFILNNSSGLYDSLPSYETTIANATYTVTTAIMKSTVLVCSNLETHNAVNSNNGKYFKVTLKDGDGKALPSKQVQINFNGKTYNRTTNGEGLASLQINVKKTGKYDISVVFNGDSSYKSSSASAKITVKKQKTSLTLNTKSLKLKTKNKIVKVTLKDQFKKAISKRTVKLIINKKTYTVKTNSKGIASFKVTLNAKKNYPTTIKFNGDSYYNSVTKKATIKIK